MTDPHRTTDEAPSAHVAEDALESALEVANIPILVMVLHQLTGDPRWLDEPYRPTRARGLDTNPSGGLPPEVREVIRHAARTAILDWAGGKPAAIPAPQGAQLSQMLSVCVGEDVAEEYADLLAQEMGFTVDRPRPVAVRANDGVPDAIVVGAGVSGLAASIALTQAGIEHKVLERHDDLGGTWHKNRYPGAGVDTPSHLYAFSFLPYKWSAYFAARGQVHDYLEEVADDFGLREGIELGREVTAAVWDQAAHRWNVTHRATGGGNEVTESASFVITAVGQLSRPRLPAVDGLDRYTGVSFHAADWPAELELRGKRVAVVGSGATAMQIVPAIVDEVDQLVVLQRSPQWIAPNHEIFTKIDDSTNWLFENVPYYRSWYRAILWWTFGDRVHESLRVDPEWEHPERSVNATNDNHRAFFLRYLDDKLGDREDVRAKAVPTYPPFGKRMLLDNGWFDALKRPNCELLDSPLARMTETEVVTAAGEAREVDVVVFATGFEAKRLLAPMDVRGRDGIALRDVWGDESPSAYLGMTVPRFPNLFVMYGPNTNLGHGGSYIFLAECQVHYIVDLITKMVERGISTVECRADVHDEYNRRVDEAHEHLVWTHPGMDTWYRNSQGRVVTNSPWRLVDFWHMTRSADLDDYVVEPTA